jgi:hypothetical protein
MEAVSFDGAVKIPGRPSDPECHLMESFIWSTWRLGFRDISGYYDLVLIRKS